MATARDDGTDVTALLHAVGRGDKAALDQVLPIVYDSLRSIAWRQLRGERKEHTLSTTALVNEAYLKLVRIREMRFRDRAHFFAMAARAMRRILVDYAVGRSAQKRGGGREAVGIEEGMLIDDRRLDDVVGLDQALERLEAVDPRLARVVECRVFTGMSVEETGSALDISPATVKRQWQAARAWLGRELTTRNQGD